MWANASTKGLFTSNFLNILKNLANCPSNLAFLNLCETGNGGIIREGLLGNKFPGVD